MGHGHSNSFRQSDYCEEAERALLAGCAGRIAKLQGKSPSGWLSPWISESCTTPDLLAEVGYHYNLNWAHDDQPTQMQTRSGKILWSIPYPHELNDIPMVMGRHLDGCDFADMLIDNFDEMLLQSQQQSLVMGIALHPYIVGQPYRLRHLRRALQHICAERERDEIWITTPGAICRHMQVLYSAKP